MKDIDTEMLKRMMMGDYSAGFSSKKDNSIKRISKRRIPVLDLHMDSNRSGNLEESILNEQVDRAIQFLEHCSVERNRNCVIIHGKGEGILKKALLHKIGSHRLVQKVNAQLDAPYFGNALKIHFK